MNSPVLLDRSVSPDQILEGYGFQTALFNRLLGVQRIYIECAKDPAQAENLCNQYLDLVKHLSESIQTMDNFDPSNPTSALKKCFEAFNGELGRRYGPSTLISEAISKNSWDCDNSAFLFYDAVRMAQVSGVEIVIVPRHCLLKSGGDYFESTSGLVQTREDTERLYARIEWEGTDSAMLFGLMFNQTGAGTFEQNQSESMSLVRIGATLGYSPMHYYALAAERAFDEGTHDLGKSFLSAASGVLDRLNPTRLFNLGEMHLKIGMWNEALAYFSEVTLVEPYSKFARLKQVHLNMELENWNGALGAFMKHLQHTTSSMTMGQVAFQIPEEFRRSIQYIREESIPSESKVAFHLMRAVFAASMGNRELTVSELEKAKQYEPEDAKIPLFRAMLGKVFLGDVTTSVLDALQEAVDREPSNEIARLELGRALRSSTGIFGSAEDRAKIIAQFEAALSINPENDCTIDVLSSLYLKTDPKKAISLLQSPRSSEELETRRYELLADAQLEMKDAKTAYENYRTAKIRKVTSGAQNDLEEKLGDCAAQQDYWELASWHYEAAILEGESSWRSLIEALEGTSADGISSNAYMTNYPLLLKYGMACVGCRNHTDAIPALTRYIDSQRGKESFDVFAYHLRGIAHQEEGDLSKAIIDLQEFVSAVDAKDQEPVKPTVGKDSPKYRNAKKRIREIEEAGVDLLQASGSIN